jgi:hypothetical protein
MLIAVSRMTLPLLTACLMTTLHGAIIEVTNNEEVITCTCIFNQLNCDRTECNAYAVLNGPTATIYSWLYGILVLVYGTVVSHPRERSPS